MHFGVFGAQSKSLVAANVVRFLLNKISGHEAYITNKQILGYIFVANNMG